MQPGWDGVEASRAVSYTHLDVYKRQREQTLGDRIGDRMRSRLAEMCVRVEMTGEDFRQTVKRARFG